MGQISISEDRGLYRLFWRHGGRRYSLSTGIAIDSECSDNLNKVVQVKLQIEKDLSAGIFDGDLTKYKDGGERKKEGKETYLHVLDRFIVYRSEEVDPDTMEKYYALKNQVKEFFGDLTFLAVNTKESAIGFRDWLIEKGLSPVTVKEKLGLLKACCSWHGHSLNPWNLKVAGRRKKRPQPFTKIEVFQILTGVNLLYPDYSLFVEFLLSTGCRTGEAIGLSWDSVNLNSNTVWIEQSMNRGKIKPTKTDRSNRQLQISGRLSDLLFDLYGIQARQDFRKSGGKGMGDPQFATELGLVFRTVGGCPIRINNFTKRIWIPLLKELHIPYRPPYCGRVTYISHLLDKDISPVVIAQVCGNSPRVIYEYYAGTIGGKNLPGLLD